MPFSDANLWSLLFEHMPEPIRYALGILTLGLFTLASHIWKRNQERIKSIEQRENNYATKDDVSTVNKRIGDVHNDVKKIMFHLIKDKE